MARANAAVAVQFSSRALSKLRCDDTGARYASGQLIPHGAPLIAAGEPQCIIS